MKYEKYKIVALNDLAASLNTWTKGEVYEVVETDTKFQLTSNEAQVAYIVALKDQIMENYKRISDEEAAAIEVTNKSIGERL